MSKFGDNPREFFENIYQNAAPWDIDGAQPALDALFDDYPLEDPVLDVGCGTGDLAIAVAGRGHRVVGIDFAEGAITQARAKAANQPPEIARRLDFQVADAFDLAPLGQQFGSIIDSGFYHVIAPADRDRLAESLATVLNPGGRYYLLGFMVDFDLPNTPHAVTADELRERFTAERGWKVLVAREESFTNRIAPVAAVAACIERLPITP